MNLEVCDAGMKVYQKKVRLKVNHSSAQPKGEPFRSCSYRISKQKIKFQPLSLVYIVLMLYVDVIELI